MNTPKFTCAVAVVLAMSVALSSQRASAVERVLDSKLHHLRQGSVAEWSDFPKEAEGPSWLLRFQSERNDVEWTLRLRQQDVRQTWNVILNGKVLGRLQIDENDTVICLPVPASSLLKGENTLKIEQVGKVPDDIRVGVVTLHEQPVQNVLSESTVEVSVTESGQPVPCRLTILDAQGALMTAGAVSGNGLAVRPGVIYTATGHARFGLPAGTYTVVAGRGFAYGIDSVRVKLATGEVVRKKMSIRREVKTPGFVSCDTHIHTLTFSGHGDATIEERMVTLAGEDIDLPIATDHNRHIDYEAFAKKAGVRKYFTPVVGNEVTTAVGHFNIFPVPADAPLPDFKLKDWKGISDDIRAKTAAKVVILNHPRDLHSGFRPFGPERFIALTGERVDGLELSANAMEVVNSGAQQTDVIRTLHDWFGLLNRGTIMTPVGSSDSHDVSRFLVGQGRTYIHAKSLNPGNIDVNEAVHNFLQGRVMVSCGLLAEITVNDKYGPGDLVPASDQVKVAVRVLGPSWVQADKIELFANGHKIRESKIGREDGSEGVNWSGVWTLPRFRHDVFLVAVATGPGVTALHWPIAKPYQPTSPQVDRRVIGATGAVWVDGDGDGKRTPAFGYAQRLIADAGTRPEVLVQALSDYDEAVAVQAASGLRARKMTIDLPKTAAPHVARAFQAYTEALRESQIASQKRSER